MKSENSISISLATDLMERYTTNWINALQDDVEVIIFYITKILTNHAQIDEISKIIKKLSLSCENYLGPQHEENYLSVEGIKALTNSLLLISKSNSEISRASNELLEALEQLGQTINSLLIERNDQTELQWIHVELVDETTVSSLRVPNSIDKLIDYLAVINSSIIHRFSQGETEFEREINALQLLVERIDFLNQQPETPLSLLELNASVKAIDYLDNLKHSHIKLGVELTRESLTQIENTVKDYIGNNASQLVLHLKSKLMNRHKRSYLSTSEVSAIDNLQNSPWISDELSKILYGINELNAELKSTQFNRNGATITVAVNSQKSSPLAFFSSGSDMFGFTYQYAMSRIGHVFSERDKIAYQVARVENHFKDLSDAILQHVPVLNQEQSEAIEHYACSSAIASSSSAASYGVSRSSFSIGF